jgi:glycosyltransferase involved in cell wall biosynthesis
MQYTIYPHWGGRAGYVRLAGAFDPACVRVRVAGASDSDADLPAWLMPAKPLLALACRRRSMPWYKVSDLVAECRIAGECISGRWDIVHFLDGEHGVRYLPQILTAIGQRGVRLVATFHQPPDLAESLVHPAVLRQLDAVILMAPSQRAWAERHAAPERVHVILHGIDVDFFRPSDVRAERQRLRCITVGHWLRDWRVFAAVASALPDIDFVAVTGSKAVPDLPNVSLRAGLSDDALAELYREADIAFLPLKGSTANNALLEGMATGLPVVATDLPAIRAYVPDDAGIFIEGDLDGYVTAIRRLGVDRCLRFSMGNAARRRAEALSWTNVARQHGHVYREVVCFNETSGGILAPP